MQRWLPLTLAVFFFVLLVGTAVFRMVSAEFPAQLRLAGAVAFYLLWLVLEAKTTRKEVDLAETPHDRGSCELYAFARGVTTITAIVTADLGNEWFVIPVCGSLVFAMGVWLRLLSIRSLGKLYSHRVRIDDQQSIVASGPYFYIRHPSYAGMLLAHLGFLLIMQSLIAFAAFAVLFIPAVVYRIKVEEAVLISENSEYANYCEGRARLIPRVW